MSRSYRKTLQQYPAHCRFSRIGRLSWKKAFRRKVNACADSDGTPILPAKINRAWPISRHNPRNGGFGYNPYSRRYYSLRTERGMPVSTERSEEEMWPGYTVGEYMAKQLRSYRNK